MLSCTPAYGLHYLLGTLLIQLLVYKKHLSCLHSILSLPDDATVKMVFLHRVHQSPNRGFGSHVMSIINELGLPSLPELLSSLPCKMAWKAHVKTMLYSRLHDLTLEAASHMSSLSDVINLRFPYNAKSLPIITCFKGNVHFARLNNFRLCLLLHCPGLNLDTAIFHPRANRSRDPLCSLCKSEAENSNPRHVISICPALQPVRKLWLPKLLLAPDEVLPHVLGGVWQSDEQFQHDLTLFFKDLKAFSH